MNDSDEFSLFPLEIWSFFPEQLSLENREKMLCSFRRVCKKFYQIFTQDEYWNPLLIQKGHLNTKNVLAIKQYFKVVIVNRAEKEFKVNESQLKLIAFSIIKNQEAGKRASNSDLLMYQKYRVLVGGYPEYESRLKKIYENLGLAIEKRNFFARILTLSHFSSYLNVISLNTTINYNDRKNLYYDSSSIAPPGSLKEIKNRYQERKRAFRIKIALIFFHIAGSFFSLDKLIKSLPLAWVNNTVIEPYTPEQVRLQSKAGLIFSLISFVTTFSVGFFFQERWTNENIYDRLRNRKSLEQ